MITPICAKCQSRSCSQGVKDESLLPAFCPIKNFKSLIKETKEKYRTKDIQSFYIRSALIEKEAYSEEAARKEGKIIPVRPRIREIAEFSKKMDFQTLGIAFCSGLSDEAGRASAILDSHGLTVASAICCCGSIDKTELGIPPEYKIRNPEDFESACNPLLQAELLNHARTDLNIIIGLCVGHDMLFTMHSHAPVTTLIVKDRFTGHNPLISLYTRYHRNIV